jgi:hypothetical protein
MKNRINILLPFFGLLLMLMACTPEDHELGALLDKSALKFTVAPSSTNPNNIVLTSLTPNLTPVWITPIGTSIKGKDTVNLAFPGTYKFVYGVESDGGLVQADTVSVTINTLDQSALTDPMWINLTGGYGQSKTWKLDVNADGTSKYFNGPVYFSTANYSGEWPAAWYSWIMPAGDYGTMTFDLKGDAHFSSNNPMLSTSASGKFMLYTDKKQLSTFGAQVVHDNSQGGQVANWTTKLTVRSLTANTLQLVAIRNDGQWLTYNYISLDYYNSH